MATTKATNLGHRSDVTLKGTTTTIETDVVVSDTTTINNSGDDVGLKINSTSSGHIMQLQDGGTDVMVVADGGKVGIGGSPTEKFNVTEDRAGNFASVIKNTNATGSGLKVIAGDTTEYSLIVRDKDDVTDNLVVLGNGNIGVGTNDPKSRLNISDSGGATTFIVTDPTRNAAGEHWYLRNTLGNFYIGQATDSSGAWDSLQARVTVENGGHVGINETSPGHVFEAKSTDNASFFLNRDAGSNEGSLSDMNNFYSLSIKNRNSGSYLRFGGGLAETTIQATDGEGTPTAKDIALQPFGGNVTIGTTGAIGPLSLAHKVTDIDTSNSAVTIGQLNGHTGVIKISSGHTSFIPFYARGGGGVAWKITWLDLDNGSWVTGNSFSYIESGSTPNTYTLDMTTGGGVFTTNRTGGSRVYSVSVFKRNAFM